VHLLQVAGRVLQVAGRAFVVAAADESSVRTAISGSRSMTSQVFRVPATVNSLGPFIVL
jgi:hypothetical protein